ncbi:MAG TPA: 5'-nucleotidase C-terminal domain-containing protein, partial [Candidatus Anoxymicrobiaceae bacterium]
MSSIPLRRALIVAAMLAIVCALVVVPAGNGVTNKAQAANGVKDFTILHTNDEHSDIYPYALSMDYFLSSDTWPSTGGFSRLAKTIGTIKAMKGSPTPETPSSDPVLTLGAGDWSQGTLFSWLETQAAPELRMMSLMGYDAVTFGNHDVELGPQYLATGVPASPGELEIAAGAGVKIPILSSNIKFSTTDARDDALKAEFWSPTPPATPALKIQPYTTKLLGNGLKVGIFGMLGVEAEAVAASMAPLSFGNTTPFNEEQSFVNRIHVAENMVNILRNTENCDVVVCLSHMGTYEEEQLAGYVPSIDVIVGGHSHDLNYPPIVRFPSGTILVQAKANSEYLGELELQYNPTPAAGRKVTVRNGTAIHMDQPVGTVPAMDAQINGTLAGLNAYLSAHGFPSGFDCRNPFSETDYYFDGGFPLPNTPEMSETQMGNLIADSYRLVAGTQIGIEANGLIRDGIVKGHLGVFSFYDMYRTIPLGASPYDSPKVPGYPLCGFYLYGSEIRGVLNAVLDMNRNDFFLQVSGVKYTYDPNRPAGDKVVSLTVDSGGGAYVPIVPTTLYKLGANYYVGAAMVKQFGLLPRDQTGHQHEPVPDTDDYALKDFIVHLPSPPYPAGTELKAWQALQTLITKIFPDTDGDGLRNIPRDSYAATQGRIIRLNSVPTITALLPATKTAGQPGFTLLVKGTNFMEGSQVNWNGKKRKTTYLSATQLSVEITTADLAKAGTAKVTVVNPGPGGGTSNAKTFTIAAPAPKPAASAFYFAEGTCRPNFDPYITIQNPGGSDADVTITYMRGDGTTMFATLNVPKNSRSTVLPRDTLGTGDDAAHDFSAKVECTNGQKIVAERPMYFNYKPGELNWNGGHDVVGALAPAKTFYFAEGTCRPGFDPYLCIQNPGGSDAAVTITYMKGDGTTDSETLNVAKNSRSTVTVRNKLGEGDD